MTTVTDTAVAAKTPAFQFHEERELKGKFVLLRFPDKDCKVNTSRLALEMPYELGFPIVEVRYFQGAANLCEFPWDDSRDWSRVKAYLTQLQQEHPEMVLTFNEHSALEGML